MQQSTTRKHLPRLQTYRRGIACCSARIPCHNRVISSSSHIRSSLIILPTTSSQMDDNDPITQFFPGQDEVDLYAVLDLKSSATLDEIKKSYRRLALLCHPDKQRDLNEEQKSATNTKFQQVGFAYAVLSDDLRRARYDTTGRTSESLFESVASGEGGWEAYFEEVFGKVSRDQLDEDKARYQGAFTFRLYINASKSFLTRFSSYYTRHTPIIRVIRVPRRKE